MGVRRLRRAWVVVSSLVVLVVTAPAASANDPVADGQSLDVFISRSVPEWNFARANNNDPCWPGGGRGRTPTPGARRSSRRSPRMSPPRAVATRRSG
jgi:hypothetical protein